MCSQLLKCVPALSLGSVDDFLCSCFSLDLGNGPNKFGLVNFVLRTDEKEANTHDDGPGVVHG